jgi:hypothetical protein
LQVVHFQIIKHQKIMQTMKNVVKTGLFALLLASASCQNNSPAPQAAKQDKDSTTTKPAEPTVLPNVKCYEGKILLQRNCNIAIVQVKNDSIGINAVVGCSGMLDNILAIDAPSIEAFLEMKEGKNIYFTVAEFVNASATDYLSKGFRVASFVCPSSGYFCPNGTATGIPPLKFAKINSYSFKNCESKK